MDEKLSTPSTIFNVYGRFLLAQFAFAKPAMRATAKLYGGWLRVPAVVATDRGVSVAASEPAHPTP